MGWIGTIYSISGGSLYMWQGNIGTRDPAYKGCILTWTVGDS